MRLLVAEDDLRLGHLLTRGLSEEFGSVDLVRRGEAALEALTEHRYDALVLDVMLPGVSGLAVCRALRDAEHWLPILMLSARADVDDRVSGLDCGADDYLAKPFSFAELSARLKALARRGAPVRPTLLRAGDLCLDPAARIVMRGDVTIDLSGREFALLEYLLRHVGDVCDRDELLEHVWNYSGYRTSNVVDQYVGYVRRKIDRPFDLRQLETLRHVGYRLNRAPKPYHDHSKASERAPRWRPPLPGRRVDALVLRAGAA